jgi:hypothetical protein
MGDEFGGGRLQRTGQVCEALDGDVAAAGFDVHQEPQGQTGLAGQQTEREALLLAKETGALAEGDEDGWRG